MMQASRKSRPGAFYIGEADGEAEDATESLLLGLITLPMGD